jgi:hypothetical protein
MVVQTQALTQALTRARSPRAGRVHAGRGGHRIAVSTIVAVAAIVVVETTWLLTLAWSLYVFVF